MSPEQFQQFAAQGYNHIPVAQQCMADFDTPLSTYLKCANAAYSYLFESVQGGEKWGRYSIIGLPCQTRLHIRDRTIFIEQGDQVLETHQVEDPLAFVESFKARYRVPEMTDLPRFYGGLVGYFGYDIVRYIEPRLDKKQQTDPLQLPDILLMVSDEIVVFDNLRGTSHVIVYADPAQPNALAKANERIAEIIQQLQTPYVLPLADKKESVRETDFISQTSEVEFTQMIEKIKDYIAAGDVMQVVPSRRMAIDYEGSPINVYRALRCLNPSPYLFFLNLDDHHIIGSSPEILTRLQDNILCVRPLAGTRPRGKTEAEDLQLEKELLADPKEIAEHVMLIDLGRNDIGRVSQSGSVRVTQNCMVERYSHVMHIVSNVEGELKPGLTAIDVLRATFPAGTLSGAPKVRAMEIIQELEPVKRSIYGGAVGYLGWDDEMDMAIAIRTAVIKDKKLYVQAGAGIVADSVPASEWAETQNKGRALFRAVAMAKNGLIPE